jgi:AraC-like DNA-binding protein
MTSQAGPLPSFPAIHIAELVEVVQQFGVTRDQLMAGMGLPDTLLESPEARVPLELCEALLMRAVELTGQPGLGILLGLRMRVPAHGYLGFAAMTAPTVKHALELAVRYAPTRTTALGLRLDEGDPTSLYLEERHDLGRTRETVLFALAVGLWRIGEALTGRRLVGVAEFAFPAPAFAPVLVNAPVNASYGHAQHRLVFERAYLEMPLVMAHPSASLLAQEQCERALEALDRSGLVARVREVLPRPSGGVRSVEEVAEALGTSVRTLHRKLKAEGVVFSELSDAHQHRLACQLLDDASSSLETVAEQVGYSDVSNFTRAFRRWTGMTPAAYRRRSH